MSYTQPTQMSQLPSLLQILLVLVVVTAGVYDIRYRRIPNWVSVAGVLIGIGLNTFLPDASGLWSSLTGLGLAYLIYFPLYLLRGMGAGDVKLMGAVGAIVGPWNWLAVFILSAMLGGLIGVILLITKGRLSRTIRNVGRMLNELAHLRPPYARLEELDVSGPGAVTLPHGAVIALGSMAYLAILRLWLAT